MRPTTKKKIKIQAAIPLMTRKRLTMVAELEGITGTQAISDLIKEEHAAYFVKGANADERKT